MLGSKPFGSHSNCVWWRIKSAGALRHITDSMSFAEYILQGTKQAKGQIRTVQNSLCACALRWKDHATTRGNQKEIGCCCYCHYLHYHHNQYGIYPLIADIFTSICKQSTVHSHLTYKLRVMELQSSGWRVV